MSDEITNIQFELFDLQKRITDLTARLKEIKLRDRKAKSPASKVCKRCNASKPREEFYFDTRYRDGLYPYCRICKAEYHARRAA